MTGETLQTDKQGRLKHFLTTEGLSHTLLTSILDHAENFAGVADRPVKKVPLLRGKTVVIGNYRVRQANQSLQEAHQIGAGNIEMKW